MAESNPDNPVAAGIAIAKDLFGLLRDAALFMVALLLIAFPTTFNTVLTNAGFEEGSFAGLKWKRQFFDTDTALRTEHDTITGLQSRNAELLKALDELKAGVPPGSPQAETVGRLQAEGKTAAEAVRQVQSSVAATLTSNEPLVAKARAAVSGEAPPSQAYCYQEDQLQPGPNRYSVHCHAQRAQCEDGPGSECADKAIGL